MEPYTIYVNEVEELQVIKDVQALDKIFRFAKSTIVQGEKVILARKHSSGSIDNFDELSNESELTTYKNAVYKYL